MTTLPAGMHGSAAFYQVAVALIPAVLFGGALARNNHEPRSKNRARKRVEQLVLALIIVAVLFAEVIAIRGAIEPASVDIWEERYLAFAVMAGSGGLAIWALAPTFHDGRGFSDANAAVALALALAFAVAGVLLIESSLERADVGEAYGAADGARLEAARELRAAEEADFAARAELIVLARTTKRPASAVSMVVDALRALEGGAYRRVRQGVSPVNFEPREDHAFEHVSAIDLRLREEFRDRLTGLDASEHLLLVLGERRMISAAKLVMTTALSKTAAAEEVETLCTPDGDLLAC